MAEVEAVVLVHGGAGHIEEGLREASAAGVRAAAQCAREILLAGGDAEEAAVAAVRELEERPEFNAGRGSVPNADRGCEMDAALMRSRDLGSGAVAAVPDCLDPIRIARRVLSHSSHRLLAGEGAVRFARQQGVGVFGREHVWTPRTDELVARLPGLAVQRDAASHAGGDTVGAVVRDRRGDLCAAGSTGGMLGKAPGRVGDTPLVGAGLYAHPELGAACATGAGEALIALVAAYAVLRRIAAGESPETAALELCGEAARRFDAATGLIVLLPDGRVAIAHRSEHMSWALARGDAPVQGGLAFP